LNSERIKSMLPRLLGRTPTDNALKRRGFDYHLVKPVNPQELEELLAKLTKQPHPS
jgi:hypothetical protein